MNPVRRPPVASIALAACLLVLAAPAQTAPPPPNSVKVSIEAALGSDGSLRGTVVATWTGACAAETRARLTPMKPEERKRALAALAGPALAGHLQPQAAVRGLDPVAGDVSVTWELNAPRFAAPQAAGGALRLGLPLLAPYDPKKAPSTLVPFAVLHDVSIRLPDSMAASELPAVFSSVTPDAGRYVLYYDVERSGGGLVLKARRELEITGVSPARLDELMEGVAARDADTLSIVATTKRPRG